MWVYMYMTIWTWKKWERIPLRLLAWLGSEVIRKGEEGGKRGVKQNRKWMRQCTISMDDDLMILFMYSDEHIYIHTCIFLKKCSVQFISVTQSCPTICDPMNRSTPGLPVHHQLPEFTQTHVHWVSDAIQPSHPLSSPFPPAPNPSQHQSLFQWVNSSHEVAKVLEFQL